MLLGEITMQRIILNLIFPVFSQFEISIVQADYRSRCFAYENTSLQISRSE